MKKYIIIRIKVIYNAYIILNRGSFHIKIYIGKTYFTHPDEVCSSHVARLHIIYCKITYIYT